MKYIFSEYAGAITALIGSICFMTMVGEVLLGEQGVIAQIIMIVQGG